MIKRRAYEEVTIAHGGNAVTLRPTLRAATSLEDQFGLPALYRAVEDLNVTVISEIILTSATSRQDAAAFLSSLVGKPLLPFYLAVRTPLAELVSTLTPAPDPHANRKQTTGKPVTWAEVFAALFDRATGWLEYTPEQAWNATPTEIDRAYRAHLEKLKAIHGGGPDKDDQSEPNLEDLSERITSDGLDPEFDRSGLHALRGAGRQQ